MTVKIQDKEFDLHYSFRIYYLFENKMKQADKEAEDVGLPKPDLTSLESTVKLLWATLEGTLRHYKSDIILNEDDIFDIIDENGGLSFINKFGIWFNDTVNAEMKFAPEPKEKGKNKNIVKKK